LQRHIENLKERVIQAKKQGTNLNYYHSYDLEGRTVIIQHPKELPNIIPKVYSISKALQYEKITKQPKIEINKKPRVAENPYKRMYKKDDDLDGPAIVYHRDGAVYETLKPAEGVIFSERGKNSKKNTVTLSEKYGRLTKTAFYSTLSEASLRASSSLPSLLSENRSSAERKTTTQAFEPRNETSLFSRQTYSVLDSTSGMQSDMTQLLISNTSSNIMFQTIDNARSHIPILKYKKLRNDNILDSNDIGDINKNIKLYYDLDNIPNTTKNKYSPILLAGKNKLEKTKKFPRKRFLHSQKGNLNDRLKKLPPPPIGYSIGHGVLHIKNFKSIY